MEILEALGRVAQNYGIGAAAAVATAFLVFRLYFGRFFDKNKELASRDDIDKLQHQLASAHRELELIRTQLARVHGLVQQQWLHGRCVHLAENAMAAPQGARPADGASPLG